MLETARGLRGKGAAPGAALGRVARCALALGLLALGALGCRIGYDSVQPDAAVIDRCTAVDCSALDNDCNVGVCDPRDGTCLRRPVDDGTLCPSQNLCALATCSLGECITGELTDSDIDGPFAYAQETPLMPGPVPSNLLRLVDEEVSSDIPIGFDFVFFGQTFSTVRVSSNGFLSFGSLPMDETGAGCCEGPTLPTTLINLPIIAVYWTDLDPGVVGAAVRFETVGSAPFRDFILKYDNVPHFTVPEIRVTAEVVLHETDNTIDIICYDCPTDGFTPHTQGIQLDGRSGYAFPDRNGEVFSLTNSKTTYQTGVSTGPDGYGDGCDTCPAISNPDQQVSYPPGSLHAVLSDTLPLPRSLSQPTAIALDDNEVSTAIQLGFDVEFFGRSYSAVYVSSNGFITFAPTIESGCCEGGSIPAGGGPDGMVAVFWADLDPTRGPGEIVYEVLGSAPNRELVIAYSGIDHAGGGAVIDAQIVLQEGLSEIELICNSCPSNGTPHTQGVEAPGGTYGATLPGRNNQDFSLEQSAVLVRTFVEPSVCELAR